MFQNDPQLSWWWTLRSPSNRTSTLLCPTEGQRGRPHRSYRWHWLSAASCEARVMRAATANRSPQRRGFSWSYRSGMLSQVSLPSGTWMNQNKSPCWTCWLEPRLKHARLFNGISTFTVGGNPLSHLISCDRADGWCRHVQRMSRSLSASCSPWRQKCNSGSLRTTSRPSATTPSGSNPACGRDIDHPYRSGTNLLTTVASWQQSWRRHPPNMLRIQTQRHLSWLPLSKPSCPGLVCPTTLGFWKKQDIWDVPSI